MNIQILVSCAGIDFSFAAGEITEISAEIGKDLIKAGYAEEVKPASAKKAKTDTSKGDADAET